MNTLIHKRTFESLRYLNSEFLTQNHQPNKKKKARRLSKAQPQQTHLGTIHYKKDLLQEIVNALGDKLTKSLNLHSLTVYVPPSLATRENSEVVNRSVYGVGVYMLRSDVFAIAIHSEKFTPETTKTNGLGIFIKLSFCNWYHSSGSQALKKRNGIIPRFCSPVKGIMVRVEECAPVETINQISNLDQIDNIKEQLLQTIQNPTPKKNKSGLQQEVKDQEIQNKLFQKEQQFQKSTSTPYSHTIFSKNPQLKKTNFSVSVHKICFTLSNDPCLSYEFDQVFQQKDQLSKLLQTQVLYLETRNQRFELKSNFKGRYQISKVQNPLAQPQRRMKFQKNVPMRKTHIQVIKDDLEWESISFEKQFACFGEFKISPLKVFFMEIFQD
ncbi:hypothetical protein M0812_24227 [Anaeramoeba flamelloides]|uniref:Uncharacterized protein n=1 Tax=Anaeramoeba flamelloides TaxID=1746091 RepID=A0AAV7YJW5_9EUKA|nr:hypothetical protein M0812_24227 [Anaeramoeba flamelloides]